MHKAYIKRGMDINCYGEASQSHIARWEGRKALNLPGMEKKTSKGQKREEKERLECINLILLDGDVKEGRHQVDQSSTLERRLYKITHIKVVSRVSVRVERNDGWPLFFLFLFLLFFPMLYFLFLSFFLLFFLEEG